MALRKFALLKLQIELSSADLSFASLLPSGTDTAEPFITGGGGGGITMFAICTGGGGGGEGTFDPIKYYKINLN